jgi:hypothetical protein
MTEASTNMRSIVQKRANEIIANKLKAKVLLERTLSL